MDKLLKFFPLVKVDIEQRLVYGLVTAEAEDKDGETCHYESTKPEYKAVNDELGKASDGQNIMPLREMHQLNAVGAGKTIDFDDSKKQIRMAFKVVDDSTWKKVTEKVLLGFSQGGKYVKRWTEGAKKYYTAQPGEVSLVDNPCLPGAFIEYAKADGTTEMFKTPEQKLTDADVERITKALALSLEKGVKYLAGAGHLPYTDESGKPSHSHMGAAWAALHGGYRGNKYEGPGKEQAIAHLKEIYRQEGMEPPSSKSILDEMAKLEYIGDSELDTEMQKITALVERLMAKQCAATGANMNPEQIKKCAAALGVSEDDFKKQFVPSDDLAKAKKGLAALHAHMEAAMEHHDAMHKAHTALGGMHEKMSTHLGKCMKACKDVMGSDEKEAEKALKALLDEMRPPVVDDAAAKAAAAAATNGTSDSMTKADAEKLIADAIKKAVEALPAPSPARLFAVPRDREVGKTQQSNVSDPFPV